MLCESPYDDDDTDYDNDDDDEMCFHGSPDRADVTSPLPIAVARTICSHLPIIIVIIVIFIVIITIFNVINVILTTVIIT